MYPTIVEATDCSLILSLVFVYNLMLY